MDRKKAAQPLLSIALAAAIAFVPNHLLAESLEEESESYEQQAEQKLRENEAINTRIASVSEQKRVIDEETARVTEAYEEIKAVLDATNARIDANEQRLSELEIDHAKKEKQLGVRVRDIYIHGQISYLDVLFGAKDFQDLMTRMDLLKRVVKQDYDLVEAVIAQQKESEALQEQLEKDRAEQEPQARDAEARRNEMILKQRTQQKYLDKLKNDKATNEAAYHELMAASKRVKAMLQARQGGYAYGGGGGGSGSMIWPISGPITSEFGWRVHPISGTQRFHSGLDIGGDYGQTVCAAAAGTVSYSGWISGYGNAVIIEHGGGISTLYGHNQSLYVSVGQSVGQGQAIAACGSTGNSTGPHCHFEVRQNGEPVSPHNYL